MFSFFQSIWTEWEREKYVLTLFKSSQSCSSSSFCRECQDQENAPSCHPCFGSSGGWAFGLNTVYRVRGKAPLFGMGTAILSGIRCRYSWNTTKIKDLRMILKSSGSEGRSVCKGKTSLSRSVLWTKVFSDLWSQRQWSQIYSKRNRSSRNKT